MEALTGREEEVLIAFLAYLQLWQVIPTCRDLGRMLGLTSSQSVHFHLKNITRKGYLSHRGDGKKPFAPNEASAQWLEHGTRMVPSVGRKVPDELATGEAAVPFIQLPESPAGLEFEKLRKEYERRILAGGPRVRKP